MPYKIRAQKKEITPLQIASRGEELLETIVSHPQWLWGGVALLALVAGITFTVQSVNKRSEVVAWNIQSEASKLLYEPPPLPEPIEEGAEDEVSVEILDETERYKKAAELYEEILETYPGSDTAMIALFESGNAYFKLASYDKAEAQYLAFLKKYPGSKGLVVLSYLKLAYLYQQKGDDAAAIDQFRKVYEMPDANNRDQAGFELARALEVQGNGDAAKALYEELSEVFSESPWGVEAKARYTLLAPPETSEGASDSDAENEESGEAPSEASSLSENKASTE